MRLIDADEAYKVLTDYYHHKTEIQHKALKEAIERVHTVDHVKHGHWKVNDNHHTCRCSCCESMELVDWALDQAKYCPNCGAKMDEVEDDKH